MPSYLYKPEHPAADKDGMIEKGEYYYFLSMTKESKQMMIGNQPVTLNFISDSMEPTRHMCNGKMYTSKKKFRDETRARGCIEIGNETKTVLTPRKPKLLDKRKRRDDIKRAVWELKNGRDIKTEVMKDVRPKG